MKNINMFTEHESEYKSQGMERERMYANRRITNGQVGE